MIRVNLLPQEYRKAEATPLKQFFATVGAAVVLALAGVGWAYVHWGVLVPTRQDKENIDSTVNTQKPQVQDSKNLASALQELKDQYSKIDKVAENRIIWSRKIDEVWEVVVSPTPANKYEVWLKGLSGRLTGAVKSGGDVQFGGTSSGPQVFKMADFHDAVKASEFFKDFSEITYPYGTREELVGADREPKEGWTFQFTMQLKPMKEMNDARAKAAAGATGKKP